MSLGKYYACAGCAFYHPDVTNDRVLSADRLERVPGEKYPREIRLARGECRRSSPAPAPESERGDGSGQGIWPAVFPTYWCGEFRSTESAIAATHGKDLLCVVQASEDEAFDVTLVSAEGRKYADGQHLSRDAAIRKAIHWGSKGAVVVWSQEIAEARPWP